MLLDKPTNSVNGGAGGVTRPAWRIGVLAGLLALHALLCFFTRPPDFLTGQDDIEYVSLGQSLRQGGYNEIWRIDAPVHSQYPPGYPALISVWGLAFGDSYASLAVMNALLSTLALFLGYSLVQRRFNEGVALTSLAVLAVNPLLVKTGGMVGSEPAFMLASMLVLSFAQRAKLKTRDVAIAIAAAVFAALSRSIGVILIGALALHWLGQRRWKALLVLAVASLVTVGAWLAWTAMAPEQYTGSSYIADLRSVGGQSGADGPSVVTRVLRRAVYYATDAVPFTMAQPSIPNTLIDNIVGVLILWPSVAVGTFAFARRWRPAATYMVLTGLLLLAWPWGNERFILPLMPLLVPALIIGAITIIKRFGTRAATVFAGIIVITLWVSAATSSARRLPVAFSCRAGDFTRDLNCVGRDQAGYFEAVRYINEHTPRDAVVLAAKSGALYHYTGRKVVSYRDAQAQGPEGFRPYLDRLGADWIVVTSMSGESRRMMQIYEANCDYLSPEASFPEATFVLHVLAAADSAVGQACKKAIEVQRASEREIERRNPLTGS
jgi:4-amino-4-deoxy-L-arabinose transferase-like glycosyltransferase